MKMLRKNKNKSCKLLCNFSQTFKTSNLSTVSVILKAGLSRVSWSWAVCFCAFLSAKPPISPEVQTTILEPKAVWKSGPKEQLKNRLPSELLEQDEDEEVSNYCEYCWWWQSRMVRAGLYFFARKQWAGEFQPIVAQNLVIVQIFEIYLRLSYFLCSAVYLHIEGGFFPHD